MEIVLFVSGLIVGGLTTWFCSHVYYKKSTRDLQRRVNELSDNLRPKTTIQDFDTFLESSTWTEQEVGQSRIWVCDADNTFQMARSDDDGEPFDEPWTQPYPDSKSYSYYIYLKINGHPIKQIRFVSVDGGRIFVPMPEQKVIRGERCFFWVLGSLELKVCKHVGRYYNYNDIEGVANHSEITLLTAVEFSSLDRDERLGMGR